MAKDSRGLRLFSVGVLALCASIVATPSHAAVGRTAGSVNVSNTGAFTYSIPIFTPPGPKGVQPSVALTYNSNAGVGSLGRGWAVSGELSSSIRRCGNTLIQDGSINNYVLQISDSYCLDGNRLRLQSGSQGASGSIYMTEVADFSKITASGTTSYGPQYWVVQRKDGLTYYYGATSDSRVYSGSVISEWRVSEIRDRVSNRILFTWKSADTTTAGTTHPVKIEWTQTSSGSGSYVYRMDFIYSAGGNAPASSYFYRDKYGPKSFDTDLLAAITVSTSGTVKRKYLLTYDDSPATDAKLLAQVQECSDSAGTDCLSPTSITYGSGTTAGGGTPPVDDSAEYDFNGDGIEDFAYFSGTWYVQLSGVGTQNTGAVSLYGLRAGKLMELPGDQLLGVSGGLWYVYYWNGSSFSATSTGISSSTSPIVSDLDGDGRDDLAYLTGSSGVYWDSFPTISVSVVRNTSTGSSLSFASPVSNNLYFDGVFPPGFNDSMPLYPPNGYESVGYGLLFNDPTLSKGGDANGDGRHELNLRAEWSWCFYYAPYPYGPTPTCMTPVNGPVLMNFPVWADTSMYAQMGAYSGDPWWADWTATTPLAADFNGDGCDDYLVDPYSWGTYSIGLSSCSGIGGIGSVVTTGGYYTYAGFADWNGDGTDDFFATSGDVLPMFGDSFGTPVGVGGHTRYILAPDLVSQIEDGFGVTYEPTYTDIAYGGNYTADTGATYPDREVYGGVRVVASVTASDGVGGTYDTDYEYYGARKNMYGRGFLGFSKIKTTDSRSGIKHVQEFERAFPYSGSLKADRIYQPDGTTLISEKILTMSSTALDSTPYNERHFRYISAIAENVKEVDGAKDGQLITSTAVSNTYDSWGNLTASTSTVTDEDSSSPNYLESWTTASSASFTPNTTYWCLGLPTTSSTTSSTTVSGESSVTRSTDFTPDYGNCRIDVESIEPSSSTLRVDSVYLYDAFNNLYQVQVTGRNPNGSSMSTRYTTTSWGTTGQFPVSSTNAQAHATTRTFDSTFGSLLTETDPNGIVVATNEYDSFGRTTRSIRADGTATRYDRVWCSPYCKNGDPASGATGINKVILYFSERNTSDAEFAASEIYTDQFDRPIIRAARTLSGSYDRVGLQYDEFGRIAREAAPCDYYSCTAYWTTNTYDLLGRLSTQSRPTSDSNATPVTTNFAYAGRTQTITDPNSKVTTKVMDVNGWMRQSRDHDSYGQDFSYDAAGSLKGVTDTLSNTLFTASYGYGAKPFQTATTDMDLGSWTYTYNSLGELVSWTDANSNSFSQTYDALSRVLTRTESEGTTTWTWGTSSGSHNIGQLSGVSMTNYSEALSYDSFGRPSTRAITADSNTYNIDYAYTNQGALDTLTYPTSTSSTRVKVKYGYAYGILNTVTDWTSGSAGTVYWTANTKNPRGQTTQETLGNGVVTNRSLDAVTGFLNSIQSGVSGGTGLQNQSYLYDALGNITQRQESTLGLTENFYYDNLYRLDYSTLNNGGGATTNLNLTYNAMGNITARTDVNGNASWTYNGTKKHAVATTGTGGTSYSYDNNGNMTSRGGETIAWTSYNYADHLSTATEDSYFTYGPDRQYYKQQYTAPGVSETTYYIGGLLEKVDNGSTVDWRHTIMAEGQTVAIVSRKSGASSANTVNYPLEDNQGSSSTLTNSGGTLLVRASYNAFGLPRDGDDWDGAESSGDLTAMEGISRRGYTGHSMLGRMGLIHMNGRVQDAVTGRFLSPDPTIPSPGFTQSYNRYAYVNNNPMSFIDPSGFCPEEPCGDELDYVEVTGTRINCDWWCALERAMQSHCRRWGCDEPVYVGAGLPLYYPGAGGRAGTASPPPPTTPPPTTPPPQEEKPQSEIPPGVGAKSYGEAEEIARRIANEELERTRRITDGYRLGGHNDLYDAERHARWTYRMSMEIGSGWAGAFATGHELQESLSQPRIEMRMDLNNNAVGMQAAMNGSGIPTRSTPGLVYIANGQLQGY